MTFSIIAARHVTARERDLIRFMAETGADSCHTNRIAAKREALPDGTHKVTFSKVERDDWGRPVNRLSHAVVQFA